MNTRFVAAKMFFALAAVFAMIGAARFHHSAIGAGLTAEDLLIPLFWVEIPRLVPFAASLLSICFGVAYFGIEKNFGRRMNIALAVVHFVSYVLAVLGHTAMIDFWWQALNESQPSKTSLPMWASLLETAGIATCCLAFALNIFWSRPKAPKVSASPS